MSKKYSSHLDQVLRGTSAPVAEAMFRQRNEHFATADAELERKLISFRLAFKAGNLDSSIESLRPEQTQSAFLRAELFFVKASYYAQVSEHRQASQAYSLASALYRDLQLPEREALSLFNALIGRTYLEAVDEVEWRELAELCAQHNIFNVQYLLDRHQSYELYKSGSFELAIRKLLPWVARTDVVSKSDSELALLHIADCFVELGDLRKAILYLDQVNEPFDERVRFPKAVVDAKIFRKPLDIAAFAIVTDHWRARYGASKLESAPAKTVEAKMLRWHPQTGTISRGRTLIAKIKTQSLEGRLLGLLIQGSRTKAQLAEALWPETLEGVFLSDRFHQLVQRVERKIPGLIVFDGQAYRLSEGLRQG